MSAPERKRIPPHASIISETLRNFGYSLETALADIIDNSITAGSANINIFIDTVGNERRVGILDDGSGMTAETLHEALRWGSSNPADERAEHDLGRFGIGLKTASFSQARRLTVVTRINGETSAAAWDLDLIAEENDWLVEIYEDSSGLPWVDELGPHGTLVILEKLDRLVNQDGTQLGEDDLTTRVSETIDHLALVFHRFLAGEAGQKRTAIQLNYRPIEPFDPFNRSNVATWHGHEQSISIGDHRVNVQAFILPHEKTYADPAEWKKYGKPDGYLKMQGFYVYRQRRLIIHGTWFRMAVQREATRLARVRVDMPNTLDMEWKIDVKKASAQLPSAVRRELQTVIDQIVNASRRPYTTRGTKLVDENRLPIWTRRSENNQIRYRPNQEHPIIQNFKSRLPEELKNDYLNVLDIIGGTLPMDTLFSDLSGEPGAVSEFDISSDALKQGVVETYKHFRAAGFSDAETRTMMEAADYFKPHWDAVTEIIDDIKLN